MVESVIERILVVDDEDSYRVLLLEFLKRLGYICRGATDAFEALERLGEEQYDLVISDIVMKGRNGVELTREARRLYPDTDFLIMTGHSKEYSYLDIIEAGASDYILKPFDSAEVKAKIARIAREKQAIRRLSSMNESISWELALNSAITDLAKAHLDTHESEKLSSLLLEHAMNLTLSSMGCIRHFDIKHAQSFCSNGPGHFCEKFPDEDAGRYVNPSERLWDLCRNELEPVFFNLDQQAAEGSELAIFRFISVPIAFDGSIVGRIILANSNRDYTAKDLSALTHLTSVYALMIKNIQINAEMKRTKDHLEAIFDGSPAAIGIIDRSWTPIKWNKGATELFGYTGDELSEIKVHELYADKDSLNKMLARLHRDGFVRRYEIEMRRKDGRIAPAELSIHLLKGSQNETTGSVCIATDVSDLKRTLTELNIANNELQREIAERKRTDEELRQSEHRFREILENVNLIALMLDAHGRISFCNEYFRRMVGYRGEEILDLDWFDTFLPNDVRDTLRGIFASSLLHGEIPAHYENDIITPHGDRRSISWNNLIMFDLEGNPIGLTSIGEDITDRKWAEKFVHVRLSLLEFATSHSLEELLQKTLDEVGTLTDSPIGFFHFVESDQKTLSLQAWSTRTLNEFCKAEGRGQHYPIAQAGVWVDCIHEKRPVIHNNYLALTHRKGMPDGHAAVIRELAVPIIRSNRIVAILGIGNKTTDYTREDVEIVSYLADVAWEVAERKRTEVRLHESERRFREILENIQLLAVSLDAQGRISFCNDFFLSATGWRREEVIGLDWFETFLTPESRDIAQQTYIESISRGEIESHYECEINTCLGKRRLIAWNTTLLRDLQGKVIGATKIGRDVGQRRRMEKELREASAEMELLIDSIPSILIELSGENRIIRWNFAAENTFGRPAADVIGLTLTECPLQWNRDMLSEGLLKCRSNMTPVRTDDIQFMKPDGTEGLLGLTISPITSDRDQLLGLIILGADITAHRLLERQLAQAQKLESIGQLAAGIAHEINTPTQYVGDNTRFLMDAFSALDQLMDRYAKVPDALKSGMSADDLLLTMEEAAEEADLNYLREEIPKAIQQSLEGVDRVSKIVRAMKEFSHPGSTEKVTIDINKAIESTITVARNEWKYVADMVTDFDSSLPLVPCFPGELNQVILNLIINASHAIAEAVESGSNQKGTISVSTRNMGDSVEIRISDTGTGVPQGIRSRIFDPFFTTKEVGRGTGQGLAIAHSVVKDKHGGTIRFETAMGKGTTFVINLPSLIVS